MADDETSRVAEPSDVDAVAQTLAGAFFNDPVWGWVFNEPQHRHDQQAAFWALFVAGSIEHRWVWTTSRHEAVSLWIPPGCPELIEPYKARLEPLVEELVGPRSQIMFEVLDRFEAAHPAHEEHFYLSLLGTHPDHRGNGTGMRLLAENLARIDERRMPAYLESTNPANLKRYESVGFEVYRQFELPEDGPVVTTMWRRPRQS